MIGWCHEFTFYFGYTVFNKLKQSVKTNDIIRRTTREKSL